MNKFTIFNLQFSKNFQLFNLQPILKIRELSFDWDLKIRKLKISQKGFIKFTKRTLVSYLIISTVFFGTGLIYLFNPFGTSSVDAAWFNDNWGYRKAVPISSHTAAETTKYITVTIANTDTLVTNSQLQSDCGDMRFTKQNGDLMPYYIASGCNTSSTVVHVYFDSFPAGAQTIYFYYGNPSVVNGFSATDFASEAASYVVGSVGSEEKGPAPTSYWKFDEGQGTIVQDSTSGNKDGTITGATWKTEDLCLDGKCLGYDGASDYVDYGTSLDLGSSLTVSSWVKLNTNTVADYVRPIFAKGQWGADADGDVRLVLYGATCATQSGTGRFAVEIQTSSGYTCVIDTIDAPTNVWVFLSATWDGSTIKLYRNGVEVNSSARGGTLANNSHSSYVGAYPNNVANTTVNGFIDEVKIYKSALTGTQILANYNARSNPEGLSAQLGNNTQNMPGALSNGLVGYWKMDEASGNASDSSGNANTLTNNNSATYANGKFANAGSLSRASTQYFSIAGGSQTGLNNGNNTGTLSIWAYPTSVDSCSSCRQGLIRRGGITGDSGRSSYFLDMRAYTSFPQIRLSLSDTGSSLNNTFTVTPSNDFILNTWYHIAASWDGSKVSIYLNGQLLSTQSYTGTVYSEANQIFGLGTVLNDSFDGRLDEARVYSRALSPAEISQLYNWAPGPVGYWKLDDKTGTTAIDSSGNGNNGTLTNSPTWKNAKYGGGVDIDTSIATNQYVNIGTGTVLNDVPALTASTWIQYRTEGVSSQGTMIGKVNTSTNLSGWNFRFNGSVIHNVNFTVDYDGATDLTVASNQGLSSGVPLCGSSTSGEPSGWCYLTVTWDGTSDTSSVKFYLNGLPMTIGSATAGVGNRVSDATSPLRIGNNGSLNRSINGVTDDTKVYNYVRTQAQIIEDMNAGHPAPGSPVGTPLGYWKFDEGYSTTANNVGSAGNSGTTYTGTITNMSSPATTISGWTNNGKFGKGLLFDGTNDRVDYGDMTVLEGISQATWSMWVNPTSLSTSQGILVKANNASTGQSWAIMTDASDSTAVRVRIATGATDVSTYGVTPTGALANGRWTHIEAVFDGTGASNTDRLKIYINGTPQTLSFTGTIPTTLLATGAIMRFSGWSDAGGSYFNGAMDELKIYTEPLTASQVKMDFNRSQSEVLGALSDSSTAGSDNTSTRTAQSNASQYCIPGDTSTCSGPSGEWMLNEGSGTSVNDSSGNAGTGTITAGTGKYVNGKINKAYQFDGTDTLINAGSGSPLDNLPASGMTAEAWIYPTGAGEGNAGFIMAKNNGNSQNAGWLFLTLNTGGPTKALQFVIDGSTDLVKTTSDNVYSYNTWNHVAVTSNSNFSAGSAHIYVNGKEVSYSGSSGGSSRVSDAASSFYIGNASSSDRTFAGIIDQVRVFNYERTPAQIAWDYNQGKPIAHWKMDECQGTTINDISGNTETGTLTIGGSGGNTTAGTCTTSGAWFDGVTGKLNYSMDLDGTDDYITMGTASYNLQTGDAPFTIALWAKPSATRFDGCYFSYGAAASGQVISLCAESSNKMYSVHYSNDHAFTTTWTLGSWQHVILSYDPTSSTESLYVNGQLKETWTPSNLNLQSSATSYIGRASWSGTYVGATQIDDVKLYNYSLTASQAKTLFNDGATRYGPSTGAP